MQQRIFVKQQSVRTMGAASVLRAVVVDDEPAAVEALRVLVEQVCGDLLRIEGAAHSAAQARLLLQQLRPDVLFLDVEMPGESGFQLLQSLPRRDFAVIFVTAYDRYAIQALRMSAMDYLLKPVDPDELREAVMRLWQQRQQQRERLEVLLSNLASQAEQRLVVPILKGYQIVALEDIIYLQSEGSYSRIYTTAERLLTTRPLAGWDELLTPSGFFRIHRAFLVNMKYVKQIRRDEEAGGGMVLLTTGDALPVSRRRFPSLLAFLTQGWQRP